MVYGLRLQQVLFALIVLLFSFVALFLGWLVARHLFSNSTPKVDNDPLLLRPYAFDIDIAKGSIDPLAISPASQVVFWSVEQVVYQNLTGLSRQKSRFQLKRIVQYSGQISRDRLLELLAESEMTSSLRRKAEIRTQIANLTSEPHQSLRYGVFLGRSSLPFK